MRHLITVSRQRPVHAQLEILLQLVGLLSSLLGILQQFSMLFSIDLEEKYNNWIQE